ncbi:MAG: protein-export chaperone SecB [Burkholderiales bacterium]|jgi:preprotein translocase subunit SecB|nr:protein-export chaperone SecB [Burkholderiales bacterium]
MAENSNAAQPAAAENNVQIRILKIYVKDLSIENPAAPQIFQQENMPNVEMGLRAEANKIADDTYESLLTVTLTLKLEDKTVLLVEAKQAGIFNITGMPEAALQPLIATHLPSVLFPYAREVVASAVGHAGFPPFYLPPTNLEALYQQQLAAKNQLEEAPVSAVN